MVGQFFLKRGGRREEREREKGKSVNIKMALWDVTQKSDYP